MADLQWPGTITHVDSPIELHPDFTGPIEFYTDLLDQISEACTKAQSYGSWAIAHPVHEAIKKSLLWALFHWYIEPNPDRMPTEFI